MKEEFVGGGNEKERSVSSIAKIMTLEDYKAEAMRYPIERQLSSIPNGPSAPIGDARNALVSKVDQAWEDADAKSYDSKEKMRQELRAKIYAEMMEGLTSKNAEKAKRAKEMLLALVDDLASPNQ